MADKNWKWVAGGASALVLALAGGLSEYYEGKRNTAYRDVVGVLTICYGHTSGVKPGDRRTDEECSELLKVDLAEANRHVKRCIPFPLPITMEAALTSATLNLGPSVVCKSTLQRLAIQGDLVGACRQLTEARNTDGGNRGWSFAGGKFYQGLYNRRLAEQDLCLNGLEGLAPGPIFAP